jgi:dCTP deaminase
MTSGPAGVLTDEDIIAEAGRGRLIAAGFEPANVQQACYELRAGNVYYDISGGKRRIQLSRPDDFILLKPHQLAVVITMESLLIPADVIGRILMKGKLFSLGLQPINTYADPGFRGRLGIVIYNASPRFIKINQGDAIAKIEFDRLPTAVARPYSGQHGYQTEIWPIPDHMILSEEEVRDDPRLGSPARELQLSFGDDFARIVDRVFRYERLLILSTLAYLLLSGIIIVYAESRGERFSTLSALGLGLVTNLISGLLIYVTTDVRRRGPRR